MSIQVCHFHADEGVRGTPLDDSGALTYTCIRTNGHPVDGPYSWLSVPVPSDDTGVSGLAVELGLDLDLPAALGAYPGQWVEFGVLEHAFATAHPGTFAELVNRYGHTAIKAAKYTASAFLARTLGDLSRTGSVLFHQGPATGRWKYNSQISWWALPPEPDWDTRRVSWSDTGLDMGYVPGSVE